MTTQSIKPCPFCRGEGKLRQCRLNDGPYHVRCSCDARGPKAETPDGAIALWNSRADSGPAVVKSSQEEQKK